VAGWREDGVQVGSPAATKVRVIAGVAASKNDAKKLHCASTEVRVATAVPRVGPRERPRLAIRRVANEAAELSPVRYTIAELSRVQLERNAARLIRRPI
jgi:hypothetical protein